VTAIAFVAVLHHYQVVPGSSYISDDVLKAVVLDGSMLVFLGILIAVCVTDFKEKLIPHEITYPSIIIGIAFSAWVRQDVMPTLAGIGISYILFDFLAFYGLKMYYIMHRDDEGAKQLEHAVRAVDGDTLATVRVANIEDAGHVIHVRKSEPYESASLVERKGSRERSEPSGSSETSEHSETSRQPGHSGHGSAMHQLEEAAVRSAMFAEAEDAVPDRVILLAEPGEALAVAPLKEPKPGVDEVIDFAPGKPEQANNEASGPAFQATYESASLMEESSAPVKESVQKEPSSVLLVNSDAVLSPPPTVAQSTELSELSVNPDKLDFFDPEIDEAFGLTPVPLTTNDEEGDERDEEFEVMGGGDAVLAALIAAWLGLENLGVTLVLGFLFGSLMGSGYLAYELQKLGSLTKALKSTGFIIAILLAISEGTIYLFASNTGMTAPGHENELRQLPWIALGLASIFGGILLGTITNGREGSKPFPFGPALAAGAAVAVFADPFHKIIVSDECIRLGTTLLDMMGHN
jgi:prepilin signal peptidase PulO-like enzyme (type II secretory pathway)